MSHKRKCGCVISDGRDSWVRKGYSLGGEVLRPCFEHGPLALRPNAPKDWDRCLYCDASIKGEHASDGTLHDPYCPHGQALRRWRRERDQRLALEQVLRQAERIGAAVDEPEGARYIQLSETLVERLLNG